MVERDLPKGPKGKNFTVLYVDDETQLLNLTKRYLDKEGYNFKVDTTTSAEKALELIEENKYDAIISDYKMPVMDGLDFLKKLREDGDTTPFIILTGKGSEKVAIEALNEGADYYVQKDLDTANMYETLAHVVKVEVEKGRLRDEVAKLEAEQKIILDSVPAMVFHVDNKGNCLYANKSLADTYGMSPEDFKGKSTKELFPEHGEEYFKSDEEVFKTREQTVEKVVKFNTPKGEKLIEFYKIPLKDSSGETTSIIGLAVDITERMKAEEEVHKTYQQMQDIIEFFPDATFVIDQDKKVVAWNLAIEKMTGVRKEDMIGKADYEYAVPFYGFKRPILVDLILSGDEEIESRYDCIKREGYTLIGEAFLPLVYNGKGAYLWAKATPFFDDEGNITGAIESIHDITERKHAEETLRESEEKYRSLVESVEDSVYVVDKNCNYKFLNQKHLSRLGLSVEEIEGKNYAEFHSEKETKDFAEKIKKVFRTGKSVQYGYKSYRDGEYFFIRTLSPVKDSKGEIYAITIVSKNITPLKKKQEELKLSEQGYKQAHKTIVEVGHCMSHDLRSPLITIDGFVEILKKKLEGYKELLDEEGYKELLADLEIMSKAAGHSTNIISDLTDYLRGSEVKLSYEDINSIVSLALDDVLIPDNVGIKTDLYPKMDKMSLDPTKIRRVFDNLIKNAAEAMPDGGEISINTEEFEDYVKIEIGDTGSGIPPEIKDKLFAETITSDKKEGTGIGLLSVKRIVDAHEGNIDFETELGKGTKFTVTLPKKEISK